VSTPPGILDPRRGIQAGRTAGRCARVVSSGEKSARARTGYPAGRGFRARGPSAGPRSPQAMRGGGSHTCFEVRLPADSDPDVFGQGRGYRWRPGGESEAVEDGLRGVRWMNRHENPHAAAAARAPEDVQREDTPQ
jgi:hypothetical protein